MLRCSGESLSFNEEPTTWSYSVLLKILTLGEHEKHLIPLWSNLWAVTHLSWRQFSVFQNNILFSEHKHCFLLYFMFSLKQTITILWLVITKNVENFIFWVILPREHIFIYITYNQEPGQQAVIIRNASAHICLSRTVSHGVPTPTI